MLIYIKDDVILTTGIQKIKWIASLNKQLLVPNVAVSSSLVEDRPLYKLHSNF